MKPENEIKIFGYVDPFPPFPNSWKARVFALMEKTEAMNNPDLEALICDMLIYQHNKMMNDLSICLQEIGFDFFPKINRAERLT